MRDSGSRAVFFVLWLLLCCGWSRGALVGSNSNNGTTAGVGAWNSNNTASNSNSNIGSQAGFFDCSSGRASWQNITRALLTVLVGFPKVPGAAGR